MGIFTLLTPSEEDDFKTLILFRFGNNISELEISALDKLLRKMKLPVTASYNIIKISSGELLDFSKSGGQKIREKRIAKSFSGQLLSWVIFIASHYFIYLLTSYIFTKGLGFVDQNSSDHKIWLVGGAAIFLSIVAYSFLYKLFLSNCSYLKFRFAFLFLGIICTFLLPLPNQSLEWKWHLLPLSIVIGNWLLNSIKLFLFDKKLKREGFMGLWELIN